MQNEDEFIYNLVEKQRDCEFSLRFFIQKESGDWKNIFSMLKLVKKGIRKEVDYNYGQYVLGEKVLPIKEGLKAISSLYDKKNEERKLVIPTYDEFSIRTGRRLRFLPSRQRYGLLEDVWPTRFSEFEVVQEKKGSSGDVELLKEGYPYYPGLSEAAIDFFELAVEHFTSYGTVYVVIVDYRARIESLKLIFSKLELKLDSPEITYDNLLEDLCKIPFGNDYPTRHPSRIRNGQI